MTKQGEGMTVHQLSENGQTFYVVVDRNGNFYAKTYFEPDARLIAQASNLRATLEAIAWAAEKGAASPHNMDQIANMARESLEKAKAQGESK